MIRMVLVYTDLALGSLLGETKFYWQVIKRDYPTDNFKLGGFAVETSRLLPVR